MDVPVIPPPRYEKPLASRRETTPGVVVPVAIGKLVGFSIRHIHGEQVEVGIAAPSQGVEAVPDAVDIDDPRGRLEEAVFSLRGTSGTSEQTSNRRPSGDHEKSDTPPASNVRHRASPPCVPMSHTCRLSFSSGRRNPKVRQSGENLGAPSFCPCVNSTVCPDSKSMSMIRDRPSNFSASTQDRVYGQQ